MGQWTALSPDPFSDKAAKAGNMVTERHQIQPHRRRIGSNEAASELDTGGVAWDSPLGRVSREPEGPTRNDPSRGARGEEHPIGPPWRGLTQPRETHVFPNPGPLEGPGSLWKLPQCERMPDPDMISTGDKIPPEFYSENLKNLDISPEVLILGKS